jgi:hypothetical protein
MDINQDILERKFKEIMAPFVYGLISKINSEQDEEQPLLVVSGGEALNFYINNLDITKTGDFDLKIVPKNLEEYLRSNQDNKEEVEIMLLKNQEYFANEFITGLNYALNLRNNNLLEELEELNFTIQPIFEITQETTFEDIEQSFELDNEFAVDFFNQILGQLRDENMFNDTFKIYFYQDEIFRREKYRLIKDFRDNERIEERHPQNNLTLITIDYNYTFLDEDGNQDTGNTSIIDLFPLAKKDLYILGFENQYSRQDDLSVFYEYRTPENQYEDEVQDNLHRINVYMSSPLTFDSDELKEGYVRQIFTYKQIDFNNIYITTLGFVVWDTVLMLNKSLNSMINSYSRNQNVDSLIRTDESVKFERYLQKYLALIKGLTNPINYLNCESMKDYIEYCTKGNQVCVMDNFNIPLSVDEVNQIIRARSNSNLESLGIDLTKVPFKSKCESVDGKVSRIENISGKRKRM